MACCSGSCSCGKSSQTRIEEQVFLAQLPAGKGMDTKNLMSGFQGLIIEQDVVEVRFKNNRREFYKNPEILSLCRDDRVVVSSQEGYDVGTVSLTGERAKKQFKKNCIGSNETLPGQIYRKATDHDISQWLESRKMDRKMLVEIRDLANSLGLEMNISDVELRGDGKKVTFFYTADSIIDIRQLLKRASDEFSIKIEMKQIGAGKNNARTYASAS